jgi:hypothetical protein
MRYSFSVAEAVYLAVLVWMEYSLAVLAFRALESQLVARRPAFRASGVFFVFHSHLQMAVIAVIALYRVAQWRTAINIIIVLHRAKKVSVFSI